MQESKTLKGFTLAILAAALWGISGSFGQFLFQQRGVGVEWLLGIRMLSSGLVFLTIAGIKQDKGLLKIWENRRDAVRLVLFSLAGMLAVQYTYFAAIKYSNAATATILQYLGPVIIFIYLAVKNRRLPRLIEYVSILLAITGTFLLVTHGNPNRLSISGTALMLGIASAFALAFYTLQPVVLLNRFSSAVVIGWSMFIGGAAISLFHPPWQAEGIWDGYSIACAAFVIIFGTLVPFYAYLSAVQLIGGQKTSLLASVEPLSATLMTVLLLHLSFQLVDWIGSACIIATVFLLRPVRKKKKR